MTDPTGRPAREHSGPPPGLCAACCHTRRVETRAGSLFWLCERSLVDPIYTRYPALPVLRCTGFEPRDREGAIERA